MARMSEAARVGALAILLVWASGCEDKTCRGVVAIGAEFHNAELLKEDGSRWQWHPGSADPVRSVDVPDAVGFANAQLCVRLSTGGVWCDPLFVSTSLLSDVADLREVSTWYEENPLQINSCAVMADGTLNCMFLGETGFSPRAQGIRNVAVGAGHFCAVTNTGSIACQPNANGAQTWSGAALDVAGAVEIVSLVAAEASVVRTVAGQFLSINQGPPGAASSDEIVEIPITGIDGDITQLVAGLNFGCALRSDGAVFCWSDADREFARVILGVSNPDPWVAQRITLLPRPATALAAGNSFVCALLRDSTVMCWGTVGAERKSGSGNGGFVESCG